MKAPNLVSFLIFIASLASFLGTAGAAREGMPGAAAPTGADRVGFPARYRTQFRVMGGTVSNDAHGLTTVYANDLAAAAAGTEAHDYPYGAVILMEFAEPQRDGEDQLLRDARGQPIPGPILHIDVMRREAGFGAGYGASRAGEWEFASYRADGGTLIPSSQGAHCAACHLKAGAEKDFVFRKRSWVSASPQAPGTAPDPPMSR